MSDILKLKYKVGEIEFEAEGPAEAVEQQRVNFMNAVLPAAVEAMVRTQTVVERQPYIESATQPALLEAGASDAPMVTPHQTENDFSRTSLASFLKKYGTLGDQDFTLFAAYFDEKKNGTKAFSIENVKQYYQEGRRPAYSNNGMLLKYLVQKGYIMDTVVPEGAKPGNYYMLTTDGIAYIESYVPQEDLGDKKKPRAKKATNKKDSVYLTITADDLNLAAYPEVKSLSPGKEQVIMAMYIVTNENKGEWFTVDDVIYLLTNIFEIPANVDNVNGVFKRNKSWFTSKQDDNNKKAYQRKLLTGAKDFAKRLISK
ncbi:unknown [Sutterella sp. CAG:521]|nr:unknown [Sutterella sp. CAG:521]